MKHLEEEELVALYYGEGEAGANAHMQTCRECFTRFAELKESLAMVRPERVPQRGAEFAERIWRELQPQLVPYEKKSRWSGWMGWRAALAAVSCAVVLAGVFVAGRYWERAAKPGGEVAKNTQGGQRVVLVVLTDHLDRTERMLVHLEHAKVSDSGESAELQTEARELLASNRLYRTTANQAGDPALAGALDRLEGVLAEIANGQKLTAADVERVRKEMDTDGILFEIRVLLARDPRHAGSQQSTRGALL